MPSTFAWLDYSEKERRRALDVIGLFKQRETRDELGIASVRDALSELFSPGTTTIQTRAKYFFLVPWVYLDFERRKTGSDRIERRGRSFELGLIDRLAESEDSKRIIGIEAGRTLQRLPSNIYWAGLRRWGILLFAGSQQQYHRYLDSFHQRVRYLRSLPKDAESTEVEPTNWHPHIPAAPDEFPEGISLQLSAEEGEYLRERIRSTCQGSLLAHLVELDGPWSEVAFAWQHPALGSFPARLAEQLEHARKFSEVMHGAALLYNLMLANASGREDWIESFEERFDDWTARASEQVDEWRAWDRNEFWNLTYKQNRRIPPPTKRFAERWISLAIAEGDPRALRESNAARQLIRQREARLKGGRARLHNRRHLELWRGDSGSGQLKYRWPITQTLALDILEALS